MLAAGDGDDVRAARARDRRGPGPRAQARQARELRLLRRPPPRRHDPPGADGARHRHRPPLGDAARARRRQRPPEPPARGRPAARAPVRAGRRAAPTAPRPTARSPSACSRSWTRCWACGCRRCSPSCRSTSAPRARSAPTRGPRARCSPACSPTRRGDFDKLRPDGREPGGHRARPTARRWTGPTARSSSSRPDGGLL